MMKRERGGDEAIPEPEAAPERPREGRRRVWSKRQQAQLPPRGAMGEPRGRGEVIA